MAYLFPNNPVGALSPAVLRTFGFLKALPDTYWVWHRLALWGEAGPDFLVVNERGQALLIKVSAALPAEARPAVQLLLIDDERPPIGLAEEQILGDFLQRLDGSLQAVQKGIFADPLLHTAVLFPNIPSKHLALSRPLDHPAYPLWLGREVLQSGDPSAWTDLFTGPPLAPPVMEHTRRLFAPETVVPTSLTVRQPSPRRLSAGLTDYLLDYDQEAALKADMELGDEAGELAKDFRLNLVNGVAGSGKTLILLFRLRLLQSLYPHKRFLVLTHNRPLIRDLQSRYYRLCASLPSSIEWDTFLGWCRHHWPNRPPWVVPLGLSRRKSFLRAVHQALFKDTPITDGMLRGEIDWIKDQLSIDRESYLLAERRGRGFRLSREQRERIFMAYERYEAILAEKRVQDWGDVPRQVLAFLDDHHLQPEPYDVVLVDEAQFFAPLWLEIVRRLVKPGTGHLFLAADPTQGFLRQGTSWKSMGLQVRGRSARLYHSYRTTQEILQFATLFYRQRVLQDAESEDVLAPDLLHMPSGPTPYLIHISSRQDEITRVANEVTALVKAGIQRRDILVLHAHWQGAEALVTSINRKLGRSAAGDPKNDYPGDYVRVTTLNAGTGLESPVVFIAGLQDLFEEEQSLRLAEEERETVIVENTRKIYMAATRAGQRLVFTYSGPLPEILERLCKQSQVS